MSFNVKEATKKLRGQVGPGPGSSVIRNVMALIVGVLSFYLLHVFFSWILVNLGILPLKASLSASDSSNYPLFFSLLEKGLKIEVFVVYPASSLITGGIVGFIGKKRLYWIGVASILPHYIRFANRIFDIYDIYSFFTFMVPVIIGVFLSKRAKDRGWV